MAPFHTAAQSGLRRLGGILPELRRDNAGNIFPMAVGAIFVMAALVGGGLDASRSYRVKNRLQNACDAGVLAGRRAVTTNGYDSTAKTQATTFFGANYDDTIQGTTGTAFVTTSADNGITVTGTATTTLKTLVMKIFGKTTMNFAATCTAKMEMGNADVTFVLDTTGSMADQPSGFTTSKIVALQTAVKNFYTTIANSTVNTNARIRYAFVPYASSVNVGALIYNLNPAYLTDTYTVQSRIPRFELTNYQTFSGSSTQYPVTDRTYYSTPNSSVSQYSNTVYNSWGACRSAKPYDLDSDPNGLELTYWLANGSSTVSTSSSGSGTSKISWTQTKTPQTARYYICNRNGNGYSVYYYNAYRYYSTYTYVTTKLVSGSGTNTTFDHFDYRPTDYDVSQYKAFNAISIPTGNNGAATSATWAGCIEERFTVPSSTVAYSTTSSSITPATALDLDIDSAPTSDPATQWSVMMPEAGYYRSSSSSLLATSGTSGGTYCPAQAQGLSEMTQTAFNTYVNALSANGGTYHDIGMLWGARLSSPDGIFGTTVNTIPANQGRVSRHVIFMTDGIPGAANFVLQAYGIELNDKRITADGSTSDDDRHEMRFRAICDAVKAKGIRVWVIGYTTSLTSDLSYCASPNSSFTAMYASDLNTAFQQIARQVSQLQVTQ